MILSVEVVWFNTLTMLRIHVQMADFKKTASYKQCCALAGSLNITGLMVGSFILTTCMKPISFVHVLG